MTVPAFNVTVTDGATVTELHPLHNSGTRLPVHGKLELTPDQPILRAGLSAVVEIDTGHRRRLFGYML